MLVLTQAELKAIKYFLQIEEALVDRVSQEIGKELPQSPMWETFSFKKGNVHGKYNDRRILADFDAPYQRGEGDVYGGIFERGTGPNSE